MSGAWVAALDQLQARGLHIDYYDPDGSRFGLPTDPYHCAPDGLQTRRQLRASGLRPAGQPITGQIIWEHRGRRRIAYLYRVDLAAPKRQATPAQLNAPGRSTWPSARARTARCSWPRTGGGWAGTAPGGSFARPPAGPGPARASRLTRFGTRSAPPRWMLGSHCATCKRPPLMPTPEPRCATTGPVAAWTGTPPA